MANFIVTNLDDAGAGSLRDALTLANANADADTITFAVGGTIILATELALTNDVTIDGDINGDDKADITISGGTTTRIMNQTGATTDVALLSLTLANGNAVGGDGGAILVNYGSLVIGNTTLRNNVAGDDGGAIRTQGTTLTIYNSLLHNNSAAHGGGLYVDGTATTIIANSTIHNNIASDNGGGVYVDVNHTLKLYQSTVTSNAANADNIGGGTGGGIFLYDASAQMTIVNTVVASNFQAAAANDVTGTIGTSTHSVFGTAVTITNNINNINNLQNVGNPGLNSLSDHGGTVLTQNMIAESVLINAGFNGSLPSADVNGNPRIVAGTVDVGATEFQLVVTTSLDTVANDGFLSLREAVTLANAEAGADVITFSANIASSTIILGSQLNLTSDITINGDTNGDRRADIVLSGGDLNRIINQTGTTTDVRLESLNFVDGNANGANNDGGAVAAFGGGTLDIRYSGFANNAATDNGGAVLLNGVTANITNSTFVSNTAGDGGAIYAIGYTPTTISNTTIHLNSATDRGGGVYIDGNATISNSTITDNRSDSDGNAFGSGGGVFKFSQSGETLSLTNTVVANNFNGSGSTLQDVNTGTSSQVFGLDSAFSTNADVSLNGGTLLNQSLAQLALGTFTDNGGPVFTRALGANSVLIDAGRNVYAAGNEDAIGGNRIAGNRVDIGAVEQQLMVTNTFDAGFGSLRAAVDAANANADHSTITFAANLAGQTITLLTELGLTSDITIDGDVNNDNTADITLSGGTTTRIVHQTGGDTDVKLMSLTLTGGSSSVGAAIFSYSNAGSLEIRNSNLLNNVSTDVGGALATNNTTTTIINTLVQGNSALRGGGLYFYGGSIAVVNSTVVGNSSLSVGGGIYSDGNLSVFNSTITGNRANSDGIGTDQGGGIFKFANAGRLISILNTVLADNVIGTGSTLNDVNSGVAAQIQVRNSAFGSAAAASISSYGTNLFSQSAAQLALGELLDNGGTTLTRSMLDGSVLINAGANGFGPIDTKDIDADGNSAETLPLDGRNGQRVTGVVDIGAVEQIVDETIRGTAGNNNIIGGLGIDNLSGLAGDDNINGGVGGDTLDGGSNTAVGDTVDYSTSAAGVTVSLSGQIAFGIGSDAEGDSISGFENVVGSNHVDYLRGDAGRNSLFGGLGADVLVVDVNDANLAGEIFDGGGDSDTLQFNGQGNFTVDLRDDTITSIENLTLIDAGANNTRTLLLNANQFGGTGIAANALVAHDTFSDTNEVFDILMDTSTTLTLAGLTFNSLTNLNTMSFVITGDGDGETITGSSIRDTINGGGGVDTLNGGAGNDTINGGSGFDTINGGAGDDIIIHSGGDFGGNVDGGADTDVLDLSGWTTSSIAFSVNLLSQNYQFVPNAFGASGTYVLLNVENVIGSNFNDFITGDGLANVLEGGLGNDVIDGGLGSDTLSLAGSTVGMSVYLGGFGSAGSGYSWDGIAQDNLTSIENVIRFCPQRLSRAVTVQPMQRWQ